MKKILFLTCGIKENVSFVIRDGENELRSAGGRSGRYAGDCGVWDGKQGRVVKTLFVKMKITL